MTDSRITQRPITPPMPTLDQPVLSAPIETVAALAPLTARVDVELPPRVRSFLAELEQRTANDQPDAPVRANDALGLFEKLRPLLGEATPGPTAAGFAPSWLAEAAKAEPPLSPQAAQSWILGAVKQELKQEEAKLSNLLLTHLVAVTQHPAGTLAIAQLPAAQKGALEEVARSVAQTLKKAPLDPTNVEIPSPALVAIEGAMHQAIPLLQGMDIEEAVQIVLMQVAKDQEKDVKEVMAQLRKNSESKQQIARWIAKANEKKSAIEAQMRDTFMKRAALPAGDARKIYNPPTTFEDFKKDQGLTVASTLSSPEDDALPTDFPELGLGREKKYPPPPPPAPPKPPPTTGSPPTTNVQGGGAPADAATASRFGFGAEEAKLLRDIYAKSGAADHGRSYEQMIVDMGCEADPSKIKQNRDKLAAFIISFPTADKVAADAVTPAQIQADMLAVVASITGTDKDRADALVQLQADLARCRMSPAEIDAMRAWMATPNATFSIGNSTFSGATLNARVTLNITDKEATITIDGRSLEINPPQVWSKATQEDKSRWFGQTKTIANPPVPKDQNASAKATSAVHALAVELSKKAPAPAPAPSPAEGAEHAGELTLDQLTSRIDAWTARKDSFADLSQEIQMKLQLTMERYQRAMSTLSNLMKKISDTSSGIIGNMK